VNFAPCESLVLTQNNLCLQVNGYGAKMKSRSGFNLIELLVVISIIALLLLILLPSLGKARSSAQSAVCLSHLRATGASMGVYQANYNGWLAGPNTSGAVLSIKDNWNKPDAIPPRRTAPVQNVDWISPLMGDEMSLPADRKERIKAIFNTELRCPSNRTKFNFEFPAGYGLFSDSEINDLLTASYAATMGFHTRSYQIFKNNDDIINNAVHDIVSLPAGYNPKLSLVGTPAAKVAVLDGTRYIEEDNGSLVFTFNSFIRQLKGGNYMVYGPTICQNGDPYNWTDGANPMFDPQGITENYSYRHSGRINALYFDGHCQSLSPKQSLSSRLYWPKGSVVQDADSTYDPGDYNGQRL